MSSSKRLDELYQAYTDAAAGNDKFKAFKALENELITVPLATIADYYIECRWAQELFDLCVRTFDYPREVEMLGAGLTDAEREMLYQAFETRRKELSTHTEDDTDDND